MIIEDFLNCFEALRYHAANGHFCDEVNEVDGVTYPLICKDIPQAVEAEILKKLEDLKGAPVINPVMFMRRSPEGIPCPQQVHTDNSMGEYSLMLYINDPIEGSGTSLLKHSRTGIGYAPEDFDFVRIIQADANNSDAWDVTELIDMRPNRAFIFRADTLHRAEPVGGFGEGSEARVVLTCFFS